MRPTVAVINLSNLKFNFLNIRRQVKNCRVMAVVKADAYGHGVKEVCSALLSLEKKPEYFGVATADEGVELRNNGISQPILVFEPVTKSEAGLIYQYNLIPTVSDKNHLRILESAGSSSKPLKVHVKVDTGMNRLGVHSVTAAEFVRYLSRKKNFNIDGIYTHFASSDENDKSYAWYQLDRFNSVLDELRMSGTDFGLVHASNSGAILDMPETYFDMVRPGISLYGYYPSLETSESINLKPVMSVHSIVNSLKTIEKGDSVSYSRRFTASVRTKIAAVPIGYADGYRRNFTNKASAIINGKIFRQVGTVTMDRIMFDVGQDNHVKTGDKVILLGQSKNLKIDAWDLSKIIDTIPYEITCGISKRVMRIYK